jgi:hypothetical protein
VTYEPVPRLRIGLSGLDLLGGFESHQGERKRDPGVGGGVALFWKRIHAGIDAQRSAVYGVDASAGVNVRVTTPVDVGAGFISRTRAWRLSTRLWGLTGSVLVPDLGRAAPQIALGGSWFF